MPQFARARALESVVREIAREVTMPRYLKAGRQHKSDGSSLTEADGATQRALAERLVELIEAPILGEEMSSEQQRAIWEQGAKGLWVIDPIDGTTNFANGIPIFGLSVGFLVDGHTEFGVVYNPIADEAFYAARGAGAWLNGQRLPLRQPPTTLAASVAGADFKRIPPALAAHLAVNPPCYSLRNFGSSALEWCFVAAGRLDVYVHGGQMLWDYAAGRLLVEESGGASSALDGGPIRADVAEKQSVVVAASPALHTQWLDWLQRAGA
ncbi:inositol monophosphatase family protein [Niveibacterium umoris]|uniref:3'(2'), 5'-bisphosphate nucleotidase/myo-inositol-1(Or 4)-monophosphatase n=1 Tax=Niveibacterium umoris TaxID=1193620 RepID=A0A840BTT2_9RHOO|nr:inositol monophosphatase [Niveibacterium umoris]MBB4014809.1 3'(2'), 5'-bisphosphate nucleotidase/myo-inositol-1(or 4)-monophosphatase [Niveibacterium umoris]